MDVQSVTAFGDAPSYIAPVLSLSAVPTISDLSITSVAPIAPSVDLNTVTFTPANDAPVYTKPSLVLDAIPTISDLSVTATPPISPILTSDLGVDESNITEPSYTVPVLTAPDWTDANTWINTEEDPELLEARMKAINGQISEYTANIQQARLDFEQQAAILEKDVKVALANVQVADQKK